jgi:hypothetical protein
MVTRVDVLRGRWERRGALGPEYDDCLECGRVLGDDHQDWCSLYGDSDAADGDAAEGPDSGPTSGNVASG